MTKIVCFIHSFGSDESGAAFIEYTALLGVILAVGLATVALVGKWASTQWANVSSTLGAN
jgi:Flp pilus assembly pilin Flp